MLIEKSTTFSMRCPNCGRLEVKQINIFQLSGNKKLDIYCECGTKKASISKKGSYINIEYYCIICDDEHSILLPEDSFWSKNHLNSLSCLNTDLNLGYYGPYKLVMEELDRQQEELDAMVNELGFNDFADPEIMLEVLDYLHDVAANTNLYCECGSHDINIDLSSDKVELICNNCGSKLSVSATNKEDIKNLKSLDK
jgi:predicted RNA-binding Zn-ribbon protein involved in translation (DUF1610 family)